MTSSSFVLITMSPGCSHDRICVVCMLLTWSYCQCAVPPSSLARWSCSALAASHWLDLIAFVLGGALRVGATATLPVCTLMFPVSSSSLSSSSLMATGFHALPVSIQNMSARCCMDISSSFDSLTLFPSAVMKSPSHVLLPLNVPVSISAGISSASLVISSVDIPNIHGR